VGFTFLSAPLEFGSKPIHEGRPNLRATKQVKLVHLDSNDHRLVEDLYNMKGYLYKCRSKNRVTSTP